MVKEELRDCQLRFVRSIINQYGNDKLTQDLLKRKLIDADEVNQRFGDIIEPIKFAETVRIVNDIA